MKKWKSGMVVALFGAGALFVGCGGEAPESVRLATAAFSVEGMTCGGCAIATEISVKKLEGVSSADASYDEESGEGRCDVEYDPARVDTDAIAEAIRNAGFEPTLQATSTDG